MLMRPATTTYVPKPAQSLGTPVPRQKIFSTTAISLQLQDSHYNNTITTITVGVTAESAITPTVIVYRIPGNFRIAKFSRNKNSQKIFLQMIHVCNIKGVA